jgi:hypothetical protein
MTWSKEYSEKLKQLYLLEKKIIHDCPGQHVAKFADPDFQEMCKFLPQEIINKVSKRPKKLSRRGLANYIWACLKISELDHHLEYYIDMKDNYEDI